MNKERKRPSKRAQLRQEARSRVSLRRYILHCSAIIASLGVDETAGGFERRLGMRKRLIWAEENLIRTKWWRRGRRSWAERERDMTIDWKEQSVEIRNTLLYLFIHSSGPGRS